MPSSTDLTADFVAKRGIYSDLTTCIMRLLETFLPSSSVMVHSVTGRPKDAQSLSRKLSRVDKNYGAIEQITDLSGVRIITYFEEDVQKVAAIIEREFAVDSDNSIDKNAQLEPDRFGYRSVHYVISLNENRTGLAEYALFAGMKCEIQIRSILQHAWAEIEHDLGYKSEAAVPKPVRRRFARLASLIELADEEFNTIRAELARHKEEVTSKTATEADLLAIDRDSLQSYYDKNSHFAELRRFISEQEHINHIPDSDAMLNGVLDLSVRMLRLSGLTTLGDVGSYVSAHEDKIKRYSLFYLGSSGSADSIVPLLLASSYCIAERLGYEPICRLFRENDSGRDEMAERNASYIMKAFEAVKFEEQQTILRSDLPFDDQQK